MTDDVFLKNGTLDSCLHLIFDASTGRSVYYRGAGEFYNNGYDNNTSGLNLVYYKKGVHTWGTPWPDNVGLHETATNVFDATVYPNPAKNLVQFNTKETSVLTLNLYTKEGKLVLIKQIKDQEQVCIEALKAGLYFYHLEANGKVAYGKLLKE